MSQSKLKDALISALYSAPKPLTLDIALSIVSDYLTKNNNNLELAQFKDWFDANGETLLARINNG
jgi:hypothetical protein